MRGKKRAGGKCAALLPRSRKALFSGPGCGWGGVGAPPRSSDRGVLRSEKRAAGAPARKRFGEQLRGRKERKSGARMRKQRGPKKGSGSAASRGAKAYSKRLSLSVGMMKVERKRGGAGKYQKSRWEVTRGSVCLLL